MNLHNSKRVAFLQLCNWVSANDYTHIKDLFDGEFFLTIIHTIFGIQYESVAAVSETDKINSEEELKLSPNEELKLLPNEQELKPPPNEELNPPPDEELKPPPDEELKPPPDKDELKPPPDEELKPPPESEDAEAKNKIILEKFKFIQEFINEKYAIHSSEVISYSDCTQGNEFELAKVIIFILSETVRHFVNTNNDHYKTLSHLEVKVQEDLEECFRLFIFDRKSISKSRVEKVLSNHAKYKTFSPSKSCFITPRRSCTSKYRLRSPSTEEVLTNSPLTSFFESPVFKKEDILSKEKEITKTRSNLHEMEIKCDELQLELKEAKQKLKEKDKEINKLKRANQIKRRSVEKHEEELKDENDRLKKDIIKMEKEHKKLVKEHEVEVSQLFSKVKFLEYQAKINSRRKSYSEAGEPLEKILNDKDDLLIKQRTKIQFFESEIKSLLNEIEKKDQELANKDEQLDNMKFDWLKNESLYLEKLSEFREAMVKEDSELPATGETVGRIYEEENRILLNKIQQLEEQLEKYEMVQPEEIPVPDTNNAFNVSMPVLLNETPKTQKLENLKKHSKKDEEFSGLPDECDFSSNSEVASKNSAASSHSEVKCLQESPFTENTPEHVEYGTLWKNLENSQLESEHSDTLENLNGYSQGNLLNKSCCYCNKIESESMKMTREHAIQLEKKEEEIDKLKANLETVQQELELNKNKMEELQTQLNETEAAYKKLQEKTLHYKESMLKKHSFLNEKVKLNNEEKKRLEKIHNESLQELLIMNKQKEKQNYNFLVQIQNLNKSHRYLQSQIYNLESQKSQLQRQLKDAKEKFLEKNKEWEYLRACMEQEREQQNEPQSWPKSDSFFVEYNNAGPSKDICNESTLSGALCRKNGFQFISHDEADFLNQSSLEDIKNDYKAERMGELLKRNSILPRHLKSSYPLEMNLSLSTDKFYKQQKVDSVKKENPEETEQHNAPISKKRKRQHNLDYDVQSELAKSPLAKLRKSFKTPTSLRKLLNRNHHKSLITPKPS